MQCSLNGVPGEEEKRLAVEGEGWINSSHFPIFASLIHRGGLMGDPCTCHPKAEEWQAGRGVEGRQKMTNEDHFLNVAC